MIRSLIAAAALGAAALLAAPAHAQEAFSPDQRRAIEEIVRDYLVENPEVLRDAFLELERREIAAREEAQRRAVAEEEEALFRAPHDIVLGNPEGDVTLVEFFDYNCGFCKRALADVLAMIETDPQLRVVLKDFPVLGPASLDAAKIGAAAARMLSREEAARFHVELLNSRGQIDGARALSVAQSLGLDPARVRAEAESEAVREILTRNMDLADRLGLTGTPAWVLGDSVIFGAVGRERLAEAVANARGCGSARC